MGINKKLVVSVGVLTLIFTPVYTFATEGTCAWHGGVSCSAGPDWDGSTICVDGWRDSTELFSKLIECTGEPMCTAKEYEQLKNDYELSIVVQQRISFGSDLSKLETERVIIPIQMREDAKGSGITSMVLESQINSALRLNQLQINSVQSQIDSLNLLLQDTTDVINKKCHDVGVSRHKALGTIQSSTITEGRKIPDTKIDLTGMSQDQKCLALKQGYRYNPVSQSCEMTEDERCIMLNLGTWYNTVKQSCDSCPTGLEKDPNSNSCRVPPPVISNKIPSPSSTLKPQVSIDKSTVAEKPKQNKIEVNSTTTANLKEASSTNEVTVPVSEVPIIESPQASPTPPPAPKTFWSKIISWLKFW